MKTNLLLLSLLLCWHGISATAQARTVTYDLVLAETDGPVQGGQKAMTINGSLPGPTLRFKEGDDAVLRVKNDLKEDTSIHWHGLLLPNDQDGVPHVNMAPIKPAETREYRFRLRHGGTFWYHSHSGLQEQLGIYGSIVITPKGGERIKANRDVVAVLSDWTDEKPLDVLTQLRAGRDWQSIKKGSAQSLLGAWQNGAVGSFLKRILKRMPPMDLSDVAYRHFLVNGQPEATLAANPGESVRVRLINASAATYYFIEFAGGPVRIIAADGVDVQPVAPGRFLMAIAETYDLLVKVPAGGAYELRATAQDGSGKCSFFIGKGERRSAPDVPRANLYVDHSAMGMAGMPGMDASSPDPMSGMDHSAMQKEGDVPATPPADDMAEMDHSKMKMPADEAAKPQPKTPAVNHEGMAGMEKKPEVDHGSMPMPGKKMGSQPMAHGSSGGAAMAPAHSGGGMTSAERPGSPYDKLRAIRSTRINGNRPLREYTFRLQGDMIRFVWTLDGKTLSEADMINVRRGERVRFTLQRFHDAPPDAPARPFLPRDHRGRRFLAAEAHGGRAAVRDAHH